MARFQGFEDLETLKHETLKLAVGAVAQLGERLVCNQEATGSIPVSSTRKNRRWSSVVGHEQRLRRWRMEWLTSLGPFVVPVVAIVVGGAIAIVTMILKHQERIAKIERGIDPDAPRR